MAHKAYYKTYMMGMLLVLTPALPALAVNPAGYGTAGGEFNIKISRVPSNERAKAKATKHPSKPLPRFWLKAKKFFWVVEAASALMGQKAKGMGLEPKICRFNHEILPTRNLTSTALPEK